MTVSNCSLPLNKIRGKSENRNAMAEEDFHHRLPS